MEAARYAYRREVLDELARHGVRPRADTPPELLKEYLNDLYRYELRNLRARVVNRQLPQRELTQHVIELRRRYVLLSTPLELWIEGAG